METFPAEERGRCRALFSTMRPTYQCHDATPEAPIGSPEMQLARSARYAGGTMSELHRSEPIAILRRGKWFPNWLYIYIFLFAF